jgi:P-type E1-E2 ATPase
LPGQKAEIIRKLQSEKFKVAMVGDGINDAPALKQANVGIVFGAMGMEPAIEAGDIVLMSNDLNKILFVVGLSKKIMSIIKQNILFGFILIHFGGMTLAFLGILNPIQAALFHACSDFIVLINSFRIIRFKGFQGKSK